MAPPADRRTVAISLGDPSGIGPEIVAAALATSGVKRVLRPVVFGDPGAFAAGARAAGVRDLLTRVAPGDPLPDGGALVAVTELRATERKAGRPGQAGALAQVAYLESAIAFVKAGGARALCTAPISKAALKAAGLPYPGHTELLKERFGAARVAMMLAGPRLRVVLATIHVPLSRVPELLDPAEIAAVLKLTHAELSARFGVPRPRIAVCGLNPHAGEGGLFGDEEARIVRPGIERARKAGVRAEGPFAADGLFGRGAAGFDAVLALYHDQGLIPIKQLHFDTAVNVTLGLPIVRTSPDHGVAHDIAGKGRASSRSMKEALLLAARLAAKAGHR